MSLTLIAPPNWKAFLTGWLRAQPEVAALVSTRVLTKLPPTKTYPLLRVSRIAGGPAEGHGNWVHNPLFQLDAYGETEASASQVATTALSVMIARIVGQHTVGTQTVVVSEIEPGSVFEGFDDTAETIARCRFPVRLYVHPNR